MNYIDILEIPFFDFNLKRLIICVAINFLTI